MSCTVEEKMRKGEEKMRKGEKLTTEDLIVMQGKEESDQEKDLQ